MLLHYLFTAPGGHEATARWRQGELVFHYKPALGTVFVKTGVKREKGEESSAAFRQAGAQQGNNVSHIATGGGEV